MGGLTLYSITYIQLYVTTRIENLRAKGCMRKSALRGAGGGGLPHALRVSGARTPGQYRDNRILLYRYLSYVQ